MSLDHFYNWMFPQKAEKGATGIGRHGHAEHPGKIGGSANSDNNGGVQSDTMTAIENWIGLPDDELTEAQAERLLSWLQENDFSVESIDDIDKLSRFYNDLINPVA